MSFTTRTIVHQFLNSDGTPSSGTVLFCLSGPITNGAVTVVPSDTPTATLDNTGAISISLVANDDTGTTPAGSSWIVTLQLDGADSESYSITIPSAGTGNVDLGSLLPGDQQVQ